MFGKAQPIWLAGRETDLHLTVQFKAVVKAGHRGLVRVATSGVYHLTVNGTFVCYGPARAGRGQFRMDEINITDYLTLPENVVVLEVCGYNADSFCVMNQPSFVQAEVVLDGHIAAATGTDFTARVHPFLYRKTQRYSYQRPQVEAYHIDWVDTWLADTVAGTEPLAQTEKKSILPRTVPYPLYEEEKAEPLYSGTVTYREPAEYKRDRSLVNWGEGWPTAIPFSELEVIPTDEYQQMVLTRCDDCRDGQLSKDTYTVYQLSGEKTGMLKCRATCPTPMTLYFMFDEIFTSDGTVDPLRMECANVIRYDLCAGTHDLQFFEVYSMRALQVVAVGGACTVDDLTMVEYKHPPVSVPFTPDSETLCKITDAAVETFLQNAVDIFTDCPSRERAGWLCDSFWTGRVEYLLTGNTQVETAFLENFLHEENRMLPDGMFPDCYPADHPTGYYIPQWAMWLVMELREYRDRHGDPALIERYRPRVEKLLRFLASYENEDGLLESLKSWNFVEWSKANDLTQDVNYPTNMLYSGFLRAAADLYGDVSLLQKAEQVKQQILEQSFDGEFFVDNAIRRDGKLVLSGERTEVCQYYAFFFNMATPDTHGELLARLVQDFGPDRQQTGKWPEIWPANAFIGNYLRLDTLLRLGYARQVKENIEGYFLYMAERTGTLWENVGTNASCNHGFASHVLCWLDTLLKK